MSLKQGGKYEAACSLVMMLPSSPINIKCLDFTRCMANLLVEITTAYLPCGRQRQFVVSIEFYLHNQLFADHYTGSASPRLPEVRRWRCAGLFAHSFIYAIQISTPLLFIWGANKLVQGCCSGTEQEREGEKAFSASLLHFCAGKLYHTPTLCCHHIKC